MKIGCLFVVGVSGGGSGSGLREVEVGWKRGKWGYGGWREKLVGMNSNRFKSVGEEVLFSFWGFYKVSPWVNWGLTRLLLVARLSCSASVIAISEREVKLFALEDLAGCFPFAEVNNLVPAIAVGGGVTVVLELLFVFWTLDLVFGGVAPVATA
nr:hypothetical protein [Tanacetum cinerariifolium]